MDKNRQLSVDVAAQEMIDLARNARVPIAWDRLDEQQPQCGFGELGICCRNCSMGPCRIDPFGGGADKGVCGAGVDTIVARNLLRSLLGGGAAHSDHGREIVHALDFAADGESEAYRIKSAQKLHKLADEYGIVRDQRSDEEVAKDLAEFLLGEFGKQKGTLGNVRRAPEQQQKNWREADVTPRGVDREMVTGMHMTHIGVDNEPEHILMGAVRAALADGWGGSMIATDVSDILFGQPHSLRSRVNLGVLKADEVNVIVHGHEPTLSDVIVAAAQDPEILAEAKANGANGINLSGTGLQEICRAVGIPPVLHVGSCVDNSRILTACAELVKEGGIGDSFDRLPVAGAAPEWMSEKAISIGMYVVASGIFTVVNPALPVLGSRHVEELLTKTFEKYFGVILGFESDPVKGARLMMDHIDRKRADLGLPPPMYETPYAPRTTQAEPPSESGVPVATS